jgi:tetratricopeptide (TPR) repeat protein
MTDIAHAIQVLEREISEPARRADAPYRLGVLLLDEFGRTGDSKTLRMATEHLERAVQARPRHARSHAALGYALNLSEGQATAALSCFEEARRLNPQDRTLEVFVLTLLAETGRSEEALAAIAVAAPRHEVNVDALRRELAAAAMPTDATTLIVNGFIHARNYFRSSLADEAERVLNDLIPGRARKEATAERKRCLDHRKELARTFDATRVPGSLRDLAPWASRYGLGDDHCRPFLMRRLSKKERATLIGAVDGKSHEIQAWLDSFGNATMTDEAAAFMYLALGVEELRTEVEGPK